MGGIPVTAMRLSYVGELGWELYTSAEYGLKLWDVLFEAGQEHGIIAAGRGAFNSMRLEKGYRLWGTDMTSEHHPYEAGWVSPSQGQGRASSAATLCRGRDQPATGPALPDRRRRAHPGARQGTGVLDGEPRRLRHQRRLRLHDRARRSPTRGCPPRLAEGTQVEIEYFGSRIPATVTAEPLFDPEMERLRG